MGKARAYFFPGNLSIYLKWLFRLRDLKCIIISNRNVIHWDGPGVTGFPLASDRNSKEDICK